MNEVQNLNPAAFKKLNDTPHNTWANYACKNNVIWDQTTSNFSESLNKLIGEETRSKSVLGFMHDIVLLTARRLDTAAKTKINDHNAIVTPFATETWEQEFVLSDKQARYHRASWVRHVVGKVENLVFPTPCL
ncbi:unnamed protein product [Ectocarpus sp. CCAP 1310/34]|nr:unnamed protein product [Ectocarpus sp. CCAP 1310/34]